MVGYLATSQPSEKTTSVWQTLETSPDFNPRDGGEVSFHDRAIFIAGNTRHGGTWGTYYELREGKITPEPARDRAITGAEECIEVNRRGIAHKPHRLELVCAMLAESIGVADVADSIGNSVCRECRRPYRARAAFAFQVVPRRIAEFSHSRQNTALRFINNREEGTRCFELSKRRTWQNPAHYHRGASDCRAENT
jgi:hypothetical protein